MFHYDQETGALSWKEPYDYRRRGGALITDCCVHGYLRVHPYRGISWKAHRVIWKWMTGEDAETVDHINRNRADNRWCNLRNATQKQQNNNRRTVRKSLTGRLDGVLRLSNAMARNTTLPYTRTLPSKEELCGIFYYHPESGVLYRMLRVVRGGMRTHGGAIGTALKDGRLKTNIGPHEYYVHRIIWKMMTGSDPSLVDHINGDPSDNRWCNLRVANRVQNLGNTKLARSNTSGVKGVYWDKTKNKWAAQITINNKTIPLGRYDNIEDAAAARQRAAELHFGKEYMRESA